METSQSMICSICKQEVEWFPKVLQEEKTPIGMGCVDCGSVFHISHINSWLETQDHCPVCLKVQDQNGFVKVFISDKTNSDDWTNHSPDDVERNEIDTILKNPSVKGSKEVMNTPHWSEQIVPFVGLFAGLFPAIKIVENIDINYFESLKLIFRIIVFFVVWSLGNMVVMKFIGTSYLNDMMTSPNEEPPKLAFFLREDFLRDKNTMRWKIIFFSKIFLLFLITKVVADSIETPIE